MVNDRLSSLLKKSLLNVKPSMIRKFDQETSRIPDIIKLTLGEPNFNTPDHIKIAGIKAIIENQTHYAPNRGIIELRQVISVYLKKRYGLTYDPQKQIIVTNGASEAISTAMNGFLQPGDVVLCPSPAFGLYKNLTQINEATFVEINTEKENYKLTAKVLEQYLNKYKARVKMFILNYPNNPTGVTYSEGELKQLANVLTKFSVVVLTDEIYSELSYEEKHVSLARFLPEQTLLVNGVSKSYAMTGWRVGYLCGPEKAIANLGKIHQANVATIGTLNMLAAEEAIKNGDQDIEKMRLEYRKRRNYVCKRLKEIGMDFVSAQGAFYIYVKIPISFTGSSIDYARKLANEAHIAVIPGAAFVENDQKCFRISYAASMENLAEALRRLEKFVKGR